MRTLSAGRRSSKAKKRHRAVGSCVGTVDDAVRRPAPAQVVAIHTGCRRGTRNMDIPERRPSRRGRGIPFQADFVAAQGARAMCHCQEAALHGL